MEVSHITVFRFFRTSNSENKVFAIATETFRKEKCSKAIKDSENIVFAIATETFRKEKCSKAIKDSENKVFA